MKFFPVLVRGTAPGVSVGTLRMAPGATADEAIEEEVADFVRLHPTMTITEARVAKPEQML